MQLHFRFLLLLTLVLFSCFGTSAQHEKVSTGAKPSWVTKVQYDDDLQAKGQNTGSYRYLLLDFQTNAETEEFYRHLALQVNNSEGVQQISDFSFDFDPLFQEITIHQIDVIRNGKVIDKLDLSGTRVIQREQNAERYLYDGNLSVVFNLTDIRSGDILEYSLTTKGFNPVLDNKFSSYINLNYQEPMDKIYKRFLINKNKKVRELAVNGATEPTMNTIGNLKVYTWQLDDVTQVTYDANVPIWVEGQQSYHISEFQDWKSVVDWALPLYHISRDDEQKLRKWVSDNSKGATKDEQILNLIRFVQDDIRYLGFETGLNTMKPHSPLKVMEQRFGDCKDKSLLLVGLLKALDVEAFPLLVHSQKGQTLNDKLPGPEVFNHCVVQLEYEGKVFSIDPTIQSQGGSLEYIAFPDYKAGLAIKKGNDQLNSVELKNIPEVIVNEIINVNEDGSAEFSIRSEYYGGKADYMRSYYLNNSLADIQLEYVNFYSGLFPNIKAAKPVKFLDDDRNTSNILIVEEEYEIPNIWKMSDDSSRLYFEVNPLVLGVSLNFPKSPDRTMPYYIGEIHQAYQHTTIYMYENWGVEPTENEVENSAFRFSSFMQGSNNRIEISYDLKTKANFIDAAEVHKVVEESTKIYNDLSFYIYKATDVEGFTVSWFNVLLVIVIALLAIFLIRKYNDHELMNPLPPADRINEEVFGSWLILVMIGVTVTPLYQLYLLLADLTYFNASLLSQLWNFDEGGSSRALVLIIEFELIANMAFLCYACYFAYCFFSKRTIVPNMASFFYGGGLAIAVVDVALMQTFAADIFATADTADSYNQIFRSVLGAAIWIPYFHKSTRVRKTFVRTAKKFRAQSQVQ